MGASFLGGPLAGMAAGRLAGKVVDSGFGRGGSAEQMGSPQQGGYSFFNEAGANPYSPLGSGYQFPQANPQQSMFGPQQSIWSF